MVDIAKPLVTITGISGYIGSQVTLAFLKDGGYRIRGTVRDTTNAAKLQPLRHAFGELFEQIELVEADLTNDAQINAACAGATYVVHVASPFFFGDDESKLITPAVEGTLSVMRACKDHGVRRCVITSSIGSVMYRARPADLFNESHWTELNDPGITVYTKSKMLAEKAAWDFQASLPEAERFEIVTILPGFVLGPALKTESSFSIDFCKGILSGMPMIPNRNMPIVDVRDCAQAHLLAVKVPAAANHRFLNTNESAWMRDLVAPIAARFGPEGWPVPTLEAPAPEGFDGYVSRMDNTRSREILGLQYRPLAETMVDMAANMIELGVVTKPATQ